MFSIELFWFETLADFRRDTFIYLLIIYCLGGAYLNTHVKVRGQFEGVTSLFLPQGTNSRITFRSYGLATKCLNPLSHLTRQEEPGSEKISCFYYMCRLEMKYENNCFSYLYLQ